MLDFLRNAFETGLKTLETRLATEPGTGRFCQGDAVSHADLCLVSLWVGTGIFGIDTAAYPTVARIAEACLALPAVAEAHPCVSPAPRPPDRFVAPRPRLWSRVRPAGRCGNRTPECV